MEENKDLENAFDKLGEMLSTEEGQKQISDIIGMLSGESGSPKGEESSRPESADDAAKSPQNASGFSSLNPDMLKTAASLLSSGPLGGKKDKNTAFLEALKPFLKKERREKLDGAVKLLSAAALFKEFGGLKKGGD